MPPAQADVPLPPFAVRDSNWMATPTSQALREVLPELWEIECIEIERDRPRSALIATSERIEDEPSKSVHRLSWKVVESRDSPSTRDIQFRIVPAYHDCPCVNIVRRCLRLRAFGSMPGHGRQRRTTTYSRPPKTRLSLSRVS